SPPDAGDAASSWSAFVHDHRTGILLSAYLSGLAVVFFLWFLGALANWMREGGEGRLAAVALASGAVLAMLAALSVAIQGAVAWVSFAAAIWFLIAGATFARTGFFSPQGAVGLIALIAFLVWVGKVSIALFLRGRLAVAGPTRP